MVESSIEGWRFPFRYVRFDDWANGVQGGSGSGSAYLTGTSKLRIAGMCTAHRITLIHFLPGCDLEGVGSSPKPKAGS